MTPFDPHRRRCEESRHVDRAAGSCAGWRRSSARPPQPRRLLFVALLTLALVLCAGVAFGLAGAFAVAGSPSPATGKVTLKVGWVNEPDNLNPFIGYSTSSYLICHLNYDLLTGYKASNVEPAPELAASWSHSADGKVWTFKLRPGVKWQDGVAVHRRRRGLHLRLHHRQRARGLHELHRRHQAGRGRRRPHGALRLLAAQSRTCSACGCRSCPRTSGRRSVPRPPRTPSRTSRRIVGTGPFQTVEFKKGQYVRMVANKNYWRGAPRIDEVIFTPYQNPDTMVQELRSGAIDACWGVPEASVRAARRRRRASRPSPTWSRASTSSASTATRAARRWATPC